MRKLSRIVFSRYFISAVLILVELLLLGYILLSTYEYSAVALVVFGVVDFIALVSLINKDANPEYKVSWLVVIMLLPPIGTVLYVIFYSRRVTRRSVANMKLIRENLDEFRCTGGISSHNLDLNFERLKASTPLAAGKAHAILNDDKIANIYLETSSEYFSSGEDMYHAMLSDIAAAEKYIFLEYFIIEDGVMWEGIYSLLSKKARDGVEVRVLYDDIGCMKTLPSGFDRQLRASGIEIKRFSPVTPRLSTVHNNRDHRKILVVDGFIGYTGGVNIADEYINKKSRFGHWKDGGIRLEGYAVGGLIKLFLALWDLDAPTLSDAARYAKSQRRANNPDGGFYIPFGSGPSPIYDRPVGKNALLNLINQAERYLYITTPYLIIDYDLTESLRNAAQRGVDVRIITPAVADKRMVKVMTKSTYPTLMRAGVSIYEYAPGFIHEKTVVCDDLYAMVGTVNLDYRSLAHHYEDAVWIYGSPTVVKIRREFMKTVSVSNQKDPREVRLSFIEWCVRNLMRIFAPLL